MSLRLSSEGASFIAPLSKTEPGSTRHLSELEAKVSAIKDQITSPHSSDLAKQSANAKHFKEHFVSQLVQQPEVKALLEKHYLESSDSTAANAAFQSEMVAYITSSVKSVTAKDYTHPDQIDAMMRGLMSSLTSEISRLSDKKAGFEEGKESSKNIAKTCTDAKTKETALSSKISNRVSEKINNRNDHSSSVNTEALIREFTADYERGLPSAEKGRKIFSDLWESACKAKGEIINPQDLLNTLYVQLSKQLASEKDYLTADASKKAWHIAQALAKDGPITPAMQARMEGFLIGLNADPAALKAFHNADKIAEAWTVFKDEPGHRSNRTNLMFETAIQAGTTFERTSNTFESALQENVKREGFLKTYSPSSTASKLMASNPDLIQNLSKNFFDQNSSLSVEDFKLCLTQKILTTLQRVDASHFQDHGTTFADDVVKELAKTGVMERAFAATRESAVNIDPKQLENFKALREGGDYFRRPEGASREDELSKLKAQAQELAAQNALLQAKATTPPEKPPKLKAPPIPSFAPPEVLEEGRGIKKTPPPIPSFAPPEEGAKPAGFPAAPRLFAATDLQSMIAKKKADAEQRAKSAGAKDPSDSAEIESKAPSTSAETRSKGPPAGGFNMAALIGSDPQAMLKAVKKDKKADSQPANEPAKVDETIGEGVKAPPKAPPVGGMTLFHQAAAQRGNLKKASDRGVPTEPLKPKVAGAEPEENHKFKAVLKKTTTERGSLSADKENKPAVETEFQRKIRERREREEAGGTA